MFFILFLCIKLSFLHLSVSHSHLEYQCGRDPSMLPEITLIINSNSNFINKVIAMLLFNYKPIRACSPFYTIRQGAFEDLKYYENVIYIGISNYSEPLNNLVYAGDLYSTIKCEKTNKTEPKFDCHEMMKLVSESVKEINDGDIYDYVQKLQISGNNIESRENEIELRKYEIESRDYDFSYSLDYVRFPFHSIGRNGIPFYLIEHFIESRQYRIESRESCSPGFRTTSDLKMVLICLDNNMNERELEVKIESLKLGTVDHSLCMERIRSLEDNLLAVVAPRPLKRISSEFVVPAVFYNTPHMTSEDKTAFPNSMNLVPRRLLKYGFLKFIQTVGWQRVAIVSDDSEYSMEFENELISLFEKERIVYTVVRCEDASCDMNKIKEQLDKLGRIVIANVEEKNVRGLVSASRGYAPSIWIVRDLDTQYPLRGSVVFFIRLGTVPKPNDCYGDANILSGLRSIAHAHRNIANKYYSKGKRQFYRQFANKMRQFNSQKKVEAFVYVTKISPKIEEISKMYVDDNGAKIISYKEPFKSGKPADGPEPCLARGYHYFNPCEDLYVLLLMFVVMVFTVTFLLIMCYFQKDAPFNDIRYQNF